MNFDPLEWAVTAWVLLWGSAVAGAAVVALLVGVGCLLARLGRRERS